MTDEDRVANIAHLLAMLNTAVAQAHDAGMDVAIDAEDRWTFDVPKQRHQCTTRLKLRRVSRRVSRTYVGVDR